MEKESSPLRNILGIYSPTYSSDDPSMNVSVHSNSSRSPFLTPYLDVNPYAIQEPEFILPEGASRQRGRLEYAFGAIGGSVILGAGIGGLSGLYRGIQETKGQPTKIRRTQLINYVVKRGATTGNALGVMALMYSGFGVFLNWVREEDDDFNTISAATATGLLYKSSAGLRKCGIGGLVGAGIASMYILWSKANNNRSLASMVGSTRF